MWIVSFFSGKWWFVGKSVKKVVFYQENKKWENVKKLRTEWNLIIKIKSGGLENLTMQIIAGDWLKFAGNF